MFVISRLHVSGHHAMDNLEVERKATWWERRGRPKSKKQSKSKKLYQNPEDEPRSPPWTRLEGQEKSKPKSHTGFFSTPWKRLEARAWMQQTKETKKQTNKIHAETNKLRIGLPVMAWKRLEERPQPKLTNQREPHSNWRNHDDSSHAMEDTWIEGTRENKTTDTRLSTLWEKENPKIQRQRWCNPSAGATNLELNGKHPAVTCPDPPAGEHGRTVARESR